jgi:protein-disulfide isomerase/rhodanese-related sulfurtransferase
MRKVALLALALLGLFDSLYLWWTYTLPSRPMVCVGTGCDVVRASVYSHLWGIPLPALGVLMYAGLAGHMLAEALLPAGLALASRYAVTGISGAGFLFSLYLLGLQAFVIHAYCTWCEISALSVTGIFALAVVDVARAAPPLEPAAALARLRAQAALCAAALVVGIPTFYLLMRHSELPPVPPVSATGLQEHLVHPDSHLAGNPQAPVTVVEFGDFECPVCVRAEEIAREIRAKYGDRIQFAFRQFPLTKIHPWAEKAAEASECAAEQGKFWEAVDKLYAGQSDLSEYALKRYAAELGLDQSRFNQCLSGGSTAARVRRDAEDARALGLRATPTFFIGQRMVEGLLEFAPFAQLVEQELAARATTMARTTSPASPPPVNASGHRPSGKAAPASAAPRHDALSPSAGLLGGGGGGIFQKLQTSANACSEEDAAKPQPSLIGTSEARQLYESNPKPLFVDVRPLVDFSSGHIPGARHLPVENVARELDTLPKDRTIVFYESGRAPGDVCASSRAAGRLLLEHGFPPERVKVFQDGFAGWQKAGFEAER